MKFPKPGQEVGPVERLRLQPAQRVQAATQAFLVLLDQFGVSPSIETMTWFDVAGNPKGRVVLNFVPRSDPPANGRPE